MAIRLDYTNMLGDVVDGGVPLADWEAAKGGFAAARAKVAALRAKGVLGFLELPGDRKLADSVDTYARAIDARLQFRLAFVVHALDEPVGAFAIPAIPRWTRQDEHARRTSAHEQLDDGGMEASCAIDGVDRHLLCGKCRAEFDAAAFATDHHMPTASNLLLVDEFANP